MNRLLAGAGLAVLCGALVPVPASAVCRVVEPVSESGDPGVVFDPTTMVLYVVADDQLVDVVCPLGLQIEQGPSAPGGRFGPRLPDPATPAGMLDPMAGIEPDGPLPEDDPIGDALPRCADGSIGREIRDSVVHVVVQPSLYADGGSAGLVMPVPRRPDVHVAPAAIFEVLHARTQPTRVIEEIEFVEDPSLGYQCSDPHYSSVVDDVLAAPGMLYGCGDSGDGYYGSGTERGEVEVLQTEDGTVLFDRIPASDDYEVTALTATSLGALIAWLDLNRFAHTEADHEAFGHYVRDGGWFLAVKVTPPELGGEQLALDPLVVSYRGEELPITNRLQYDERGGRIVTDAFLLTQSAMTAAQDGVRVLHASEVDVSVDPMLAPFGVASGWLTRIEVERFVNRPLPDSAFVPMEASEVVGDAVVRRLRVRIAQACCGGGSIPDPAGARTFMQTREYAVGEMPDDDELFYMAPPADEAYCSYTPDAYYYCAADGHARSSGAGPQALLSWLPLLAALGAILARRRRRR